ncbi:MAG TPA: hypothetical protein VFS90_01370, partial [Pyrinomonadaceae bacterium]|nr:hypothetical protein [Pyrinomonadaceae bacterium]
MSSNDLHYVVPGPTIRFGRKRVYAFQLYAGIGLAIWVAINLTLGALLNLPGKWSVVVALLGLLVIPIIAMAEKIVSGAEDLCFYHHLIGGLTANTILLWMVGQPPLPFLDVMLLAAGAARAVGYLGCFRAGCCHGRPSRWGVIYD